MCVECAAHRSVSQYNDTHARAHTHIGRLKETGPMHGWTYVHLFANTSSSTTTHNVNCLSRRQRQIERDQVAGVQSTFTSYLSSVFWSTHTPLHPFTSLSLLTTLSHPILSTVLFFSPPSSPLPVSNPLCNAPAHRATRRRRAIKLPISRHEPIRG